MSTIDTQQAIHTQQPRRHAQWPRGICILLLGAAAISILQVRWLLADENTGNSIRLEMPQFSRSEATQSTERNSETQASKQPAIRLLTSDEMRQNPQEVFAGPTVIHPEMPFGAGGTEQDLTVVNPHTVVSPSASQAAVPLIAAGHSTSGFAPGQSGYRATSEVDAQQWMLPYFSRTMKPESSGPDGSAAILGELPVFDPQFVPWWDEAVRQPGGLGQQVLPVDVAGLVQSALEYSPQVLAIKAEPHIQYHVLGQEEARFDWTAFLESTYNDLNEPVGNELAIGIPGEDRLKTEKVGGAGGLRRRTRSGGELEVSQRIGHETQNSRFFTPNPQGSSRLELQFRQPLLNGSGRVVNESQIVLARIAQNAAEDEVVGSLQDHLVEVTDAYWALYRARAEYFQRRRLLESAGDVLRTLEGRDSVDTIPRQILRARAAVARSQTGIQRTLARARDAEAQLRLLVNSPHMLGTNSLELMPMESPGTITDTTTLRATLDTALQNRPDISEAIRKMRAASLRVGVSKTDLLPKLDMIVSTYVADITRSSIPDAVEGQYRDNRPSYTVGFEFEVPLGNRAARSQYEQRKWEMVRSVNVFRGTVERALTDVEISHREVATAWSEVLSRFQAMSAARNEAEYLQDRFQVLPMSEDSATLLLEDLLDALERLASEETAFVQAQTDHALAIVKLRREMGTLLRSREGSPELNPSHAQWITDRMDAYSGATSPHANEVPNAVTPEFSPPVN